MSKEFRRSLEDFLIQKTVVTPSVILRRSWKITAQMFVLGLSSAAQSCDAPGQSRNEKANNKQARAVPETSGQLHRGHGGRGREGSRGRGLRTKRLSRARRAVAGPVWKEHGFQEGWATSALAVPLPSRGTVAETLSFRPPACRAGIKALTFFYSVAVRIK